jgi:cytochrome P450
MGGHCRLGSDRRTSWPTPPTSSTCCRTGQTATLRRPLARIKPLFGEGLTSSAGAHWRRQRHLMQPLFQWQRLLPWMGIVTEATAAMLACWEPFAAHGQPLDLGTGLRDVPRAIMHNILLGPADGPDATAESLSIIAPERLRTTCWRCSARRGMT